MALGYHSHLYGRGTLKVCRKGHSQSIAIAAFARPKTMNAFNDDLYIDLVGLMNDVAVDDSIAALVITGNGKYFSSGADLKNGIHRQKPAGGRQTISNPAGRFMMSIINFPKLLAAAVQGPAVGIAVTMLFHCDLVHLSSTATLWAPFTRLALVPELCSSVTFQETMGTSKANELLLLGRRIDAKTAFEWNICSRVVDAQPSGDELADPKSLVNIMCKELDKKLLQLPLGNRTASYFVQLTRSTGRKHRLQEVCRAELQHLDSRFDSGQVAIAASKINVGSSKL